MLNLLTAGLVLLALTFVPPDNSLSEVKKSGVLRVCAPPSLPPLVTSDAEAPGYDLALLERIADDLGVRLSVNRSPAIGADFNPRNWRLTRAQCQVIAGGVIDNASTRGFLQVLPTGLQTGWAAVDTDDRLSQTGAAVAVFPGPTGLDRLALSRYLRSKNSRILTVSSAVELANSLKDGSADVIVSDRQTLSALDLDSLKVDWLSEQQLGVFNLAFGLWKGDSTLFRAVRESLAKLTAQGVTARVAAQYDVAVDSMNLR